MAEAYFALVAPRKIESMQHYINHDLARVDEELYIRVIYCSTVGDALNHKGQRSLLFIWKCCYELIFPHPFLSCFVEAIT